MDDDPWKFFFVLGAVIAAILLIMSIMQANHEQELERGKELIKYQHELENKK